MLHHKDVLTYTMQGDAQHTGRVMVIVMPEGTQFRLGGHYSQTEVMLCMYAAISEELLAINLCDYLHDTK